MNEFIAALLRLVALSLAVIVGAVFFVVFFLLALCFGVYWAVARLWARVTGKPVKPWVFQFNPQASFRKAYSNVYEKASGAPRANKGEHGPAANRAPGRLHKPDDVTDVTPK